LERIDPWGRRRADLHTARIIEAILIAAGGKPRFKEILEMFDFEPKATQSDEDIAALFHSIASKGKG